MHSQTSVSWRKRRRDLPGEEVPWGRRLQAAVALLRLLRQMHSPELPAHSTDTCRAAGKGQPTPAPSAPFTWNLQQKSLPETPASAQPSRTKEARKWVLVRCGPPRHRLFLRRGSAALRSLLEVDAQRTKGTRPVVRCDHKTVHVLLTPKSYQCQ